MANQNQRPGVYSSYSVTSRYSAPRAEKGAALVMSAPGLEEGLYLFQSYGEAANYLYTPEQRPALLACRVLFESGVPRVHFVSTGTGGYLEAVERVRENADVGAVVSDASDEDDLYDLLDSVVESSGLLMERLLFTGAENAAEGALRAELLNHERAVVCAPASYVPGDDTPRGLYTACAFAGAVLAVNDPATRFSGLALETLSGVIETPEAELQNAVLKGVSVFERVSGNVECVRAVTSRTSPDLSMRPLNVILIIDDVMRSVREGLKSLLRGLRVGAVSHESIASQTTVLLAAKRDDGIIASFEAPGVRADSEDPSVCVVEIAFKIAHVVEQIHISAHITI